MKVLGGIYRVLEGEGVGFKGFGGENEKKNLILRPNGNIITVNESWPSDLNG